MILQAHRLVEQTFSTKMFTSENFWFYMYGIKKMFFHSPFSFILTVEH